MKTRPSRAVDRAGLRDRTAESIRVLEATFRTRPNPWGSPGEFPPLPVKLGITWNEYARNLQIYRSAELVRFEAATTRELGRIFSKAINDLSASILRAGQGTVTRTLRAEIALQVSEAWSAMTGRSLEVIEESLVKTLRHSAGAVAELRETWDAYRLDQSFTGLPPYRVPNLGAFAAAVRATDPNWFLRDLVDDLSARTVGRARREILSAHLQGQSVARLTGTLRRTLGIGRTQAQNLARTSLHRISSEFNLETRKQNRDVAPREKYLATLDSRTCPVCGLYDGRIYRVGEGPSVPAHDSCRCVYVSVTKSVAELLGIPKDTKFDPDSERLRRSLDGVAPATTTWSDWLGDMEDKTPGFARPILGASRYDAWIAGDLKLSDLARNGRLRTVQQLGLE